MRPENDDGGLYDTADNRGNRGTGNPEFRCSEFTENQDVVQAQIHEHRRQTGYHRHTGLAAFTKRSRINLFDSEGNQADQHDGQILSSVPKHRVHRLQRTAFLVEIKLHQRIAEAKQHGNAEKHHKAGDVNLIAERVPYALVVSFSIKLRAVDAGTGKGAEDAQIDDEHQLVHNGDAGHRLGADPADHQVIKQAYEIGDAVLNHDRHRNRKRFSVKFSVSY